MSSIDEINQNNLLLNTGRNSNDASVSFCDYKIKMQETFVIDHLQKQITLGVVTKIQQSPDILVQLDASEIQLLTANAVAVAVANVTKSKEEFAKQCEEYVMLGVKSTIADLEYRLAKRKSPAEPQSTCVIS